ncbi:hypothetical protein EDB85DRAFT_2000024 [Lactarius pseudohatsudake]|nr:hypothetical protein EDB85DRAFT_2000024 [Lactarius pseudohatsudake]
MATTGNHGTPPPRPLTSAGTALTNNPVPSVASSYPSVDPVWAYERPPQNLNPSTTRPPLLPLPTARTTHLYPASHSKTQQIVPFPIPGRPNDTLVAPEPYPGVVPGDYLDGYRGRNISCYCRPNHPTVGNQIRRTRRKRPREIEPKPEPEPATFRCRLPQCQAEITGHVAARLSGFCSHTHMQLAIHMRMAKQCSRCGLRACPEGQAFCSAEECANRRRRSLYNILLHAFCLRSSAA